MANQNDAGEALQNVMTLNKLFADSMSPINNYVALNTQLRIAEQQRKIQRANQLADQEAQRQFLREQETAKNNADLAREGLQQAGSTERTKLGLEANKESQATAFKNLNTNETRRQADIIRADPDSKDILPGVGKFEHTSEGDEQLIAAFQKAATPEQEEKVAIARLVPATQEIRRLTDEIAKAPLDPTQAKAALYKYLADPTVNQLLIKEGKFTPDQLSQMAASGDFDAVSKAINTTASNSSWFRSLDPKVASQLLSGLLEARAGAAANPSPDSMVKAQTLKTLLETQAKLIPKVRTKEGWDQFHNTLTPPQVAAPKLPPPPAPGGVAPAGPAKPAAPGMFAQAQNDLAQHGLMGAFQNPAGSQDAMAAAAGGGFLPSVMPSAADGAAFLQGPPDSIQSQVNQDAILRLLRGGLSSPSRFDQPVPFYGPTIDPYAQQMPQLTPAPYPVPTLTQAPYQPGEPRPF